MGTSAQRRARRLTRTAVFVTMIAGFMTLGASPALAATVVCGQVITQDTKVDNDLLNCPGDGLVIGASDVKLDLGGHVIDGVGNGVGINNSGGFDNVEIVHGTVQQFLTGVNLRTANDNKLEHLTVLQHTFPIRLTLSNDNELGHLTVSQSSGRGISLNGSNGNTIAHSRVSNTFDGIHLLLSDSNRVEHNDVFSNTRSGIVLLFTSDNNTVEHNLAHDHPAWGISGNGNTGNTYAHNKVFNNLIAGIEEEGSTNMVISHNEAFDNGRGIVLYQTHASLVEQNKVRSNTTDGIQTIFGSTGNLLRQNHSEENGDDGIDVGDPGNTITKNHANKNIDFGIFAVLGNIDGGGNKAKDNGNPAQCSGVSCN